jgi:D-alanyl-D-alanine carboxypeptidase
MLLPVVAHADDVATAFYTETDGIVQVDVEGPATPDTPFAIASIGKTMTAIGILRLVSDGTLGLDDPAGRYLPQKVVDGFPSLTDITLRHLLTMTSGLPDYLDDAYVEDALADPETTQTPLVALSYAYAEAQVFAPGQGFDYSNTNYVLLGLVMEHASGLSYAQAMDKLVIQPAGLPGAFVFGSAPLPETFPNGHEDGRHYRTYYSFDGFGDGGVIASAPDLARFFRAAFVDQTLVPPPLLDEMLHDPFDEGYGMGIELDGHIIGHSGGDLGFSSDIRLDLTNGNLAIILSAAADVDTTATFDALER